MTSQTQKIALISVWDKEGILDLAKGLERKGVRMLASGGTEKIIQEAGISVENVSAITGKSSILQGRVKTLHQSVHGGILARDTPEDQSDLANEKIQMIDFVICNLYPFKKTVAKINVTVPEAVEEIDIGGVTLLRAAAKNHARATVVTDPNDYPAFLKELESGSISEATRQRFALKAFEQTASYDTAISEFFRKRYASGTKELALRYGTNPHQKPAAAFVTDQERLPFKVLCGAPGYINLLDALNAWPLVKELKEATGLPAAASFKHVSPAGAAVGVPMSQEEKEVCMVTTIAGLDDSGLAQAYARARGADRVSSFGDIIALSDEVDIPTAKIIGMEVSDGVIAPSFTKEALEILSKKKGGKYLVLQVDDSSYEPSTLETRQVHGVTLQQHRNDVKISPSSSFGTIATKSSPPVPESALRDLTVATLALKYTQSNSVCYALNGQTIGLGAGQQSRIHCTRLAGTKADTYWMRFHPRVRGLKFKKGVKRPDRSNAIDMLCSGQTGQSRVTALDEADYNDNFEALFEEADVPKPFTAEERQQWLSELKNVALSSDAFFPFTDNVVRAANSGVKYIAAPMGSQADKVVVETAEKAGITFIEQNIRLFHH